MMSSANKALEEIPDFIQNQYEKNKQPSLRQGLASNIIASCQEKKKIEIYVILISIHLIFLLKKKTFILTCL